MPQLPKIDKDFMLEFLIELLNTPSPTGYTHHAITLVSKTLKQFDQLELSATRKGALVARWPGEDNHTRRVFENLCNDRLESRLRCYEHGACPDYIKANGKQ